ncbi:MAG TPA: hypothetical protein VKV35_10085 [Streptosporangiaceae bacterium]|nr:hypothetical protein [Streptosporangiaceae bacterium]
MSDLLADAVAELYAADPDRFTERRSDLAARARAAGEQDAARQIAGLRKPTRAAWVVNRLVRADPGAASRLRALAAELRDAQAADGARIRELTAARGRLVDELARRALAASGSPSPPAALRGEVTATLDAALADPQVAAGLGTLTRAAHWAGFGPGAAPPAVGGAPARPRRPAPAAREAERSRRSRGEISAAERAVADAARDAEAAAAAERDLEESVRRLEADLAAARQRLAAARRRGYRAAARQQRAERALGRLTE